MVHAMFVGLSYMWFMESASYPNKANFAAYVRRPKSEKPDPLPSSYAYVLGVLELRLVYPVLYLGPRNFRHGADNSQGRKRVYNIDR